MPEKLPKTGLSKQRNGSEEDMQIPLLMWQGLSVSRPINCTSNPYPTPPTPSSGASLTQAGSSNVQHSYVKIQEGAAKRSAPEVPRGLIGSQGVTCPTLTQSLWESKRVPSTSWRLCWLEKTHTPLLHHPVVWDWGLVGPLLSASRSGVHGVSGNNTSVEIIWITLSQGACNLE